MLLISVADAQRNPWGTPLDFGGILCALWLVLVTGCSRKPLAIPVVSPLMSPIVSPLMSPLLGRPSSPALFVEPFEQLDRARWREIEVKGRTTFTVEDLEGAKVLKAHSLAGASILLCPFRFNPRTYEWLTWRWRVDQAIEGEDLSRKEGSDAPARVYVYFDTPGLPWQKRNLDYVWSSTLPTGTILPSAFSKASMIIVVESSREHLGAWRTVSRNMQDDYRRCYHEEPPDVLAIGLMTDADSTRTEAVAYYDDVMVTQDPPPSPPPPDGAP
jgi:hypothetical protein